MKRLLIGCTIVYAALIGFCAFGAEHVSLTVQEGLRPYLWLFGPPASLVYGTDFLWPFIIGTAVVGALVFGMTRSESPVLQLACGIGVVVAWPVFGVIVYAPGA